MAAGAGESKVVPLTGTPVFPRLCANCCQPATRRLTVAKVLDQVNTKSVLAYHPFFCDACIALHRAESKSDPSIPLRRILHGWKLWIPAVGSAWGASVTLPTLLEGIGQRDRASLLLGGGLFAFFAAIAIGCVIAIWIGSRHLAVRAPSSVTSAVHFTGDLSQTFEPAWRRFTFRSEAYAGQFRQSNRHQIWNRQRPELHRAMTLRYYLKIAGLALLGIVLVFAIADEFGYPLGEKVLAIVKGLLGMGD